MASGGAAAAAGVPASATPLAALGILPPAVTSRGFLRKPVPAATPAQVDRWKSFIRGGEFRDVTTIDWAEFGRQWDCYGADEREMTHPGAAREAMMREMMSRMGKWESGDSGDDPIPGAVLQRIAAGRSKALLDRSLDIEVSLAFAKPRVTRTLRVPANMPLSALADHVLVPAWGLYRGLHAWQFLLPLAAYPGARRPEAGDDICFAPTSCGSVDFMHVLHRQGGKHIVPADKVLLGDLLRVPGETLLFIYDFGDGIEFEVRLATAHEPTDGPRGYVRDGAGRVAVLLAGEGAGIEENPGSHFELLATRQGLPRRGGGPAAARAQLRDRLPRRTGPGGQAGRVYLRYPALLAAH